ncbi:hypothetical protein DENSPDRAFT_646612 [Dentipellis sp. KUC8613]|nr:hypothetical protein DENSPDRAFT_646612 [Dentipellis sp. KUC8613]
MASTTLYSWVSEDSPTGMLDHVTPSPMFIRSERPMKDPPLERLPTKVIAEGHLISPSPWTFQCLPLPKYRLSGSFHVPSFPWIYCRARRPCRRHAAIFHTMIGPRAYQFRRRFNQETPYASVSLEVFALRLLRYGCRCVVVSSPCIHIDTIIFL